MSDQNPYEQLGVSESASFEAIQTARDRRLAELEGNAPQVAAIHAAYDTILMDRLRLRQEGKIKVPDRIRFPEKLMQPTPSAAPTAKYAPAGWLEGIVDRPGLVEVAVPGAIMSVLGASVLWLASPAILQFAMAMATGSTLYLVFRKENKLGRAVLFAVLGLVIGFALTQLLLYLFLPLKLWPGFPLTVDVFQSLVTFVVFWLVSSFLK